MFKQMVSRYIQFLPLVAFLWTARYFGFNDTGWMYAFYAGSVIAIIQSAIFVFYKIFLNRFLLAINLFLLGGGLAFLTNSTILLNVYDNYQHIMLFVALIIVGVVTTFFTKAGFVGVENSSPVKTRRFSLYLLGASVLGLGAALVFKNYGIVSAAVILILLRFLNEYFEKSLKNG